MKVSIIVSAENMATFLKDQFNMKTETKHGTNLNEKIIGQNKYNAEFDVSWYIFMYTWCF